MNQLLCKAYGITFKRNDSKVKLSEKLTAKIRATSQIPFPGSLMGPSQQPSTSNAEQEQETAEASSDVPSGATMVPIATTDANTETGQGKGLKHQKRKKPSFFFSALRASLWKPSAFCLVSFHQTRNTIARRYVQSCSLF